MIPQGQSDGEEERYAVLVLDTLNDFVHGKLKCERAGRIIPNIERLLDTARKNKIPVFFCKGEHLPIDTYEIKLWRHHAMKGTKGAEVIDEMKPHQVRLLNTKEDL